MDLFDNKKLWNEISNNEDIEDQGMVVASLPAGKAAQYAGYTAPVLAPVFDPAMETVWDGSYLLKDEELYIFSNGEGTGQLDRSGSYVRKNLLYQGVDVSYNAIDGSVVSVEDPRTTVFQYKFQFSNDDFTESSTGTGNNWKNAMTQGGHGKYYVSEGMWADPRLTGGQPSPPSILDPEASADWIGNAGKSQSAKITKL